MHADVGQLLGANGALLLGEINGNLSRSRLWPAGQAYGYRKHKVRIYIRYGEPSL